MTGFRNQVSDAILSMMTAEGVSQRELATRMGVTEARVSNLLDRSNMTLNTVERLYTALGKAPSIGTLS